MSRSIFHPEVLRVLEMAGLTELEVVFGLARGLFTDAAGLAHGPSSEMAQAMAPRAAASEISDSRYGSFVLFSVEHGSVRLFFHALSSPIDGVEQWESEVDQGQNQLHELLIENRICLQPDLYDAPVSVGWAN